MELNYLVNIISDLSNRFQQPSRPSFELKKELINLNEYERQLVKNKINRLNWDVGALNVLKILKECEITSVSDYLSEIDGSEEKLLIFTDILDDKNSYDLIEELIICNRFDDLLTLAVKNYVNDLIHRQDIIENEIIMSTHKALSKDNFMKFILPKFMECLFKMDFKPVKELTEIISSQNEWNLEYGSFKVLQSIFAYIIPSYNTQIAREICNLLQNERDICWFFILMAIGYIKEEDDGYVVLKNLINLHINSFCDTCSMNGLHKSFILSRQFYHYTINKKKQSYQQWLKNNIGDLNYNLRKKSVLFSDIIQALENLVPFETDLEILKVHISTQISAPRKEYSTVLSYKQLLKSREDILLKENLEMTQF